MSLVSQIPDGAVVLIDTNPILHVLENGPFSARFEPVFADLDAGRIQAIITTITVAEVLAGPLGQGKEALAARYRHAICNRVGGR